MQHPPPPSTPSPWVDIFSWNGRREGRVGGKPLDILILSWRLPLLFQRTWAIWPVSFSWMLGMPWVTPLCLPHPLTGPSSKQCWELAESEARQTWAGCASCWWLGTQFWPTRLFVPPAASVKVLPYLWESQDFFLSLKGNKERFECHRFGCPRTRSEACRMMNTGCCCQAAWSPLPGVPSTLSLGSCEPVTSSLCRSFVSFNPKPLDRCHALLLSSGLTWVEALLLLMNSSTILSCILQGLVCVSRTDGTVACQAHLSFTFSQSLLIFMSIESVMLSNHLIFCHPLLLLPSIFPIIRVFSNQLARRIRWPKYWSFNFSISPSNEYLGSISFKIGWFDLLAVQGILKSLLQHHNSKASILWCSAFLMVQLSHDYWENHSFDYVDLCWQSYVSAI